MSALDDIKAEIPDFPGCEGENECRLSDEQVRAYVGERLAELPEDGLSDEERGQVAALMIRCEFMNQEAFKIFDEDRNEARIAAVLDADAALIAAAKSLGSGKAGDALKAIGAAFESRDAAMSKQ